MWGYYKENMATVYVVITTTQLLLKRTALYFCKVGHIPKYQIVIPHFTKGSGIKWKKEMTNYYVPRNE
ncbi:hypothetical protein SAMN04488587_1269 [Methanococcoides vulcani]|uniref:Uncharacterized protein n=1 Tax=Methanococcoides vulcani TaxID=1353158 RepID=A0A1H9ZWF6_9EURY|nr:hypothetical protein SAMN04488587_1269 [Methanococcoides vulcani]